MTNHSRPFSAGELLALRSHRRDPQHPTPGAADVPTRTPPSTSQTGIGMPSLPSGSAIVIKLKGLDPRVKSLLTGLDVNKHGELLCDHTWLPTHSCSHCQRLPWDAEAL